MAQIEACMIVIDVGKSTSIRCGPDGESFFECSKRLALQIVQRMIFSKPQNEVGLLLMGTDETNNQLNTDSGNNYEHICEALYMKSPNWQALRILENKVMRSDSESNWFDALVVAENFLRTSTSAKKISRFDIFLISPLYERSEVNDAELRSFVNNLESMMYHVHIISNQIVHPASLTRTTIFDTSGSFEDTSKSDARYHNESILKDIVSGSNHTLTDLASALKCLNHYDAKTVRPAAWNSTLTIGTKLSISVSAYVSIREQKPLGPFKVDSADGSATSVQTRTEHFHNDKRIELEMEDLIDGYMYGATVVPYDSAVEINYKSGEARLTCLGFTPSVNILEEYLCGKGTHLVIAKQGCVGSEEKLSALIKAMIALKVVMIAVKVYRRDTKPRINVLLPTHKKQYPCLTMLELIFQDELNMIGFAPLMTARQKPSAEQYEAIDQLINSMNLMDSLDTDRGQTREAFVLKDTFNPTYQHLYRTVAHRAMHPNATLPSMDNELRELLTVPEKLQQRSIPALQQIKNLFPLEEQTLRSRTEWLQRVAKINLPNDASISSGTGGQVPTADDRRIVMAVGTVTPAEDFDLLLRRGEKFVTVANQMQRVILELCTAMPTPFCKIIMALMMYRGEAQKLGPFRYNEWMVEFKKVLLDRHKADLWQQLIVQEKLGLIDATESEMSTVGVADAIEFYNVPLKGKLAGDEKPEDEVDLENLLAELHGGTDDV
ncbi:X-ray repair cross-complementing protein 5 [Anopheles bellator]|uniref:X-ray repair cross-complementing protein 5 n=1 Tax=Anopheles bellator TaxID=139047 RepID=UPI002648871F|nr:X-ray repair cross-complementing protein 5 [Anopheles bellator]